MRNIPTYASPRPAPGNRLLKKISSSAFGLAAAASFIMAPHAGAASGTWTLNGNGNWSGTGNWASGVVADGVGATADFSQLDINATRTVTIDTASRTVGNFLIGDSGTAAPNGYVIAVSGGASLIFDNGGIGASLSQTASSGNNSFSAPIVLNDNLSVANSATSSLTISGNISGSKNLTFNANDAGAITVSGSIVTSGTLTNSGTGVGVTTLNGVVGPAVTGVVQNSASSQLTLGAANTFTSGVLIKNGTVLVGNNAALGTGTTTIGDNTGSANATLLLNSTTFSNAIVVQAGSGSNTLSIATNGNSAGRVNGSIQLNNALSLGVSGGGQSGRNTGSYLATSGLISGTGNLNINISGAASTSNNTNQPQMDSLTVGGTIASTGLISNTGTGSGRAIISGNITSASGLNQNSATSMLTLNGTNTYSGATMVNAGVLRVSGSFALSANSAVTVASGATLQLSVNTTTLPSSLTISGTGTSYSYGALEALNGYTYAGAVNLAADALIADSLATTNFVLSGGVTGSGKTLTTGGQGNVNYTGAIATGSGGLNKVGGGTVTLSAANSFTGLTMISGGTLTLNNPGALNGGGNITFDGGALRFSSSNSADYGSRIVNSTASVSIDTNAVNVTTSNVGASNTAGLTKLGTGRLTLSGTNSFTGPIAVNAGVLAVSSTSALPTIGTGLIFLDKSGALNSDGAAYANVQAWLNSGNISTASTGAIALTGASSENIDLSGYSNLSLGASTNSAYTGTLTPAGNTYRLGGGGANLTLSAANTLSGTRSLVVSSGTVTISNSNSLSGATTVNSGVLVLSSTAGSLASSDITVNGGSTLTLNGNNGSPTVTRASSVTLNRAALTVTGTTTANSNDAITNALSIGSSGSSTVTLTPSASKNLVLTVGSLTRSAGGVGLIRGTSLGVNAIGIQAPNAANIVLTTAPTLSGTGAANTTTAGIFAGFVGDTATGGTGFGTTGGLLTYDSTYGVRLLSSSEYKTSITSGQTQLDNILLSATTTGVVSSTLTANTAVNSLSIRTSGTAGAGIALTGAGTLTVSSGVIYTSAISPAATVATVANDIDFNGKEAVILTSGTGVNFSGALTNTGGNGLTTGGPGRTVLSGATANTYTGTTTVNAGILELAKTAGVNAITGDLVINAGATVTHTNANQIADSASVFVNGGIFTAGAAETINNLSLSSGGSTTLDNTTINGSLTASGTASINTTVARTVNVIGAVNLSDGANLEINRSQNIGGAYDTVVAVGGLNITNQATGAYTAVTIDTGVGLPQSGGKLTLNGDVTFTGNTTNSNTVLIDAVKGSGRQGVVELNGTRGFNIGDGAAKVDLRITAGLQDGASAGGLTKTGNGTLELTAANSYTGATTVTAGTLLLNGSSVSAVSVTGGVFGGNGTVTNSVSVGTAGTVAAGSNGVGMLNTGDFSLTGANATISMEIAGASSYDQISVTGGVSLSGNGKISLSLTYTPTGSDIFYVVLNDGSDAITGTLFGLAQGATFTSGGYTWQVSYTGDSVGHTFTGGNDLALQIVPEPQTWALLGGAAMALLIFRRRRAVR